MQWSERPHAKQHLSFYFITMVHHYHSILYLLGSRQKAKHLCWCIWAALQVKHTVYRCLAAGLINFVKLVISASKVLQSGVILSLHKTSQALTSAHAIQVMCMPLPQGHLCVPEGTLLILKGSPSSDKTHHNKSHTGLRLSALHERLDINCLWLTGDVISAEITGGILVKSEPWTRASYEHFKHSIVVWTVSNV